MSTLMVTLALAEALSRAMLRKPPNPLQLKKPEALSLKHRPETVCCVLRGAARLLRSFVGTL